MGVLGSALGQDLGQSKPTTKEANPQSSKPGLYEELVNAFSQDRSGSNKRPAGVQVADASDYTNDGVMSDAGGGRIVLGPVMPEDNAPDTASLTPAQSQALALGYGPLTEQAAQEAMQRGGQAMGQAPSAALAQTVRAGDYDGSLERVARAQLGPDATQREINNYVGQLFEINSISDARRIGPDQQLELPGATTPGATSGLAQYGQDIGVGEQRKAELAQAQQQTANGPLPAGWNMRDASAANMAEAARRASAASPGGHYETVQSMDIAGGGYGGGTEQVWVSDGPAMPYTESVGKAFGAIGKATVGLTEMVVGGAYNAGVRIAGGAASVPYLLDSVDAAVAVQEGFKERFGYDMKSSGALAIGQAIAPAGQWVQSNVMAPTRAYSESLIGDGATTILSGGLQAGLEIAGVVTGGRAVQGFLDNSVFVTRPAAGLYGGIPVDALTGTTRITTVTAEMSERFQGMGYLDPLTNTYKAAPAGSTMAVDHIFPSTEIVRLPGFNTLTKQQMTSIIQDSAGELGNLQPLPKTFNSNGTYFVSQARP